MENNETYQIEVNLEDVSNFIHSDAFNSFLMTHTTLSTGLFISEVLDQTIKYMTADVQSDEDIQI